jgi:hypothetical protein
MTFTGLSTPKNPKRRVPRRNDASGLNFGYSGGES